MTKPKPKVETAEVDPVPDETYRPKAGQEAVLGTWSKALNEWEPVDASVSTDFYARIWVAESKLDADVRKDLLKSGKVFSIPGPTKVKVVKVIPHDDGDPRPDEARVLVLKGDHKDKTLYVGGHDISRTPKETTQQD